MTIGSAFAVSKAMESTHVAESLGQVFIAASKMIGGKVGGWTLRSVHVLLSTYLHLHA